MTGDQNDIASRIERMIPPWFGSSDNSPAINALVQGMSYALAFVYSLYAWAKLQTRVATMSGGWLDLAAGDYFGDGLRRFGNETDASYSRRIRLEVFRDRNTRNGIDHAVYDLTGNHPTIYESFRPSGNACMGDVGFAMGTAGLLGSSQAPFQVIITTPAPTGYGIPGRPGIGDTLNGIGDTFSLAGPSDVVANGPASLDLATAIDRVRTAGITYYITLQ